VHISQLIEAEKPTFSFEFFPPRSPEAAEKLFATIQELEPLHPSFVSVTYGAGGSTRELTHNLVARIHQQLKIPTIPHLTCIGHDRAEIESIIERYAKLGIRNILTLRGDPPAGSINYDWSKEHFSHAIDLIDCISSYTKSHKLPDFGIGVAGFPEGHPDSRNRLKEMDYLKAKVDAGADYIVTQLFFDNHDFFDFRERCQLAGIHVPIIAGIMPVTSLSGLQRMAELSGGSRFPAKLIKALNRANANAEAVARVGAHYAAQQCSELLNNNVDGIHFYTLNQSQATREIYMSLGLR